MTGGNRGSRWCDHLAIPPIKWTHVFHSATPQLIAQNSQDSETLEWVYSAMMHPGGE